jgi:chromatin segregation and condensation protein Rec8/ScpA/Scc1 (kleisin family)
MYQQFCKIFMDEQPMTLLVHGKVGIIQNKRFEDIKVRPTGMQNFDVWVKPENRLVK